MKAVFLKIIYKKKLKQSKKDTLYFKNLDFHSDKKYLMCDVNKYSILKKILRRDVK